MPQNDIQIPQQISRLQHTHHSSRRDLTVEKNAAEGLQIECETPGNDLLGGKVGAGRPKQFPKQRTQAKQKVKARLLARRRACIRFVRLPALVLVARRRFVSYRVVLLPSLGNERAGCVAERVWVVGVTVIVEGGGGRGGPCFIVGLPAHGLRHEGTLSVLVSCAHARECW